MSVLLEQPNHVFFLFKNKSIPKRVSEMKTSSPELWRAYETIWEISDNFEPHSDIPPLGMVLFTIITKGKHPYGLTGRKESAPDAMKVSYLIAIKTPEF